MKLRDLLQERDGTRMTFLMHAARGCPEREGAANKLQKEQAKKEETNKLWEKNQPKQKQPEAGHFESPGTYTSSPTRRASAPSELRSILESEREVELDGAQSRKPSVAGSGAFTTTPVSENYTFAQENELGVFKIACSLVKDTLWTKHVCIGFLEENETC